MTTPPKPQRAATRQGDSGFTLIELLIVVAIIGILAAVAIPALLSARRSGNQASAIASLRAIDSAQRTFASSCGFGSYATVLTQLGIPPTVNAAPFISVDLGATASAQKSGYTVTMAGGSDGAEPTQDACNGVLAADLSSTFYATAEPQGPSSGTYFYWLGVAGTIFQNTVAIENSNGLASAPGGTPIQ